MSPERVSRGRPNRRAVVSASSPQPTFEFHVTRDARRRYGIDDPWFEITGNVILEDLAASRRLAHRMNQLRQADRHPGRAVNAGSLHAMGLIDEILHFVAGLYRQQQRARVLGQALEAMEARLGRPALEALLLRFTDAFPPLAVHRGEIDPSGWLAAATAGVAHRELALEELLMLWLANANPAFGPFRELFDDKALEGLRYDDAIAALTEFFTTQPPFGPDHQSLVDMLRSPALAHPHSLAAQLEYIRTRWGHLLGELLRRRLLVTLDVIHEEERAAFMRFTRWSQTQRSPVTTFRGLETEVERFTPDRDWMPRVVMIAKSANVWLDQLARRYARAVSRLDQVPDEELDQLARWGISSLWLIGVWERSRASQRIKQLCGNPDAAASAYSLFDYAIAESLGGESAYENLRQRAERRGIRLASDMVPNHMGIDSRWVIEHPDWFLSLDHSPFPGYSFEGPDLSWDPRISIQIEDHYYDKTDAAVVFKRHDRGTGETRYVYHGNDGTLTPWNDTAQLDYLKAEVREGVIQTILHVARHFPIIRFDAAMTLAKRHYQRLWFPEPGTGGAIPSRAERGLTKEEFDRAMPVEFWREVVDRIAAELPDTLLLAEAFWLMEGTFVRSFGMHRVYNSAFMNMLRDEENANYRSVIKNTLEFDPEILKRYVNFMNNPDERTAVDQFGKGDKYFGVCTLMVTLPGLPMFGHGQIEGFTERYGMEFRRATQDETPDRWLIERHEREVFPMLHRRHVFAEAREFLLFDFFTTEGHVNEDVFAYSNRAGDEKALVLYHNRYATTAGWIRMSAGYAAKDGERKTIRRRSLGEGLGLTPEPDRFCLFREHLSGLEFIRPSIDLIERGLYAQLDAYKCQVFVDFREVRSDAEHPWAELAHELGGRGTPNVGEAMFEIQLRPLLDPFRELMAPGLIRELIETRGEIAPSPKDTGDEERLVRSATGTTPAGATAPAARAASAPDAARRPASPAHARTRALLEDVEHRAQRFLDAARVRAGGSADTRAIARDLRAQIVSAHALDRHAPRDPAGWGTVLAWLVTRAVGRLAGDDASEARGGEWLRAWRLDRVICEGLCELGASSEDAARAVTGVEVLLAHPPDPLLVPSTDDGAARLLETWLRDDRVEWLLKVHQHEGVWWFHQESWEELLALLVRAVAIDSGNVGSGTTAAAARLTAVESIAERLKAAAAESGYRLDRLVASLTS